MLLTVYLKKYKKAYFQSLRKNPAINPGGFSEFLKPFFYCKTIQSINEFI
jgi:hypothetical protein